MKKLVVLLCLITISNTLLAQAREEVNLVERPKTNFGLGAGIDYGGFGGRLTYMTTPKFGLFAGVGYNLAGAGFNGGATFKFNPDKRVAPTLGAMYGYNAVIIVKDGPESSSTYYGASFCIGIEVKNRGNENNYWNFELVLPIRPSALSDEINRLRSIGYDVSEPSPIGFSVGYHFGW